MKRHPLADCDNCTLNKVGNTFVPSDGPEDADIVIIGEAPGFGESISGKPFSGASGKLLDAVLAEHKIDRTSCFITNVCLCRPKGNETPSKNDIKCCSERLKAEIEQCDPEVIVPLGVTAASAIMGQAIKITSFRAGPPKESKLYPGTKIVPSFHPAACLRNSDSFPSLVADIAKITQEVSVGWEPPSYKEFNDPQQATAVLNELLNLQSKRVVIDIETAAEKDSSFERPNHYPIMCIGIGFDKGRVVVLGEQAVNNPAVVYKLRQLLRTKDITCHNGKFDLSGMADIELADLSFDTMLASYALDEREMGVHKLKYLAAEELSAPDYDSDIKQWTTGAKANWRLIPKDKLHRYNACDVSNTWDLEDIYRPRLAAQGLTELNDRLTKYSNFLMRVEMGGINIDTDLLAKLDIEYQEKLEQRERDLFQWVDNPRSPKQVTAALEELHVVVDTTNAEQLQELTETLSDPVAVEFCNQLLDYRKEQKLYGTYIKGARERLYNGRLYTTYLLHGTTTGRLSSRNPNFQNVPRGSTIRSLYIPTPGNVFVQSDYSQIELRVVVSLAQEATIAEILCDPNRDIFGELSAQMFGAGWTKIHRQIMKRIVHGTNYGMGPMTMATQINNDARQMGLKDFAKIDATTAGRFQKKYYAMVPSIIAWQQKMREEIFGSTDDIVTDFGRHRRFWLITEANKKDVEHEGLAFKPQSLANDICLRAAYRLWQKLDSDCHIRLLIHDSIMTECPADKAQDVARLQDQIMRESGAEWSTYVPFAVETKITAESWGAVS